MTRARPPRDRETAPGSTPGAESFARPGEDAPLGIVRLSDYFRAEDFERAPGASRQRPLSARKGAGRKRSEAVREAHPRAPDPDDRGRSASDLRGRRRPTSDSGAAILPDRAPSPDIRSRNGARGPSTRPDAPDQRVESAGAAESFPAVAAVSDATSNVAHIAAGSAADAVAHAVVDAAANADADAAATAADFEAGPAYECLFSEFGNGATSRRQRTKREPATALQRALGLLTRREHSRKELTRKLVSRGVDAGEVDAAVEKLTRAGWQDDRRFAESLVRVRAASGYGPLHIRAELGTHDLPEALRTDALEEFDGDWAAIARDAVVRRFERLEDRRLRERKAMDFLIRRGFPGELARAAAQFPERD